MRGMVLQDWITLKGAASATLTQGQASYLDLQEYDDLVLYLEVREETGSLWGATCGGSSYRSREARSHGM
jgi:hypothetical protein